MNTRNYNSLIGSKNLRSPAENRRLNGSISSARDSISSKPRDINNQNHRTIDPQVYRDTQSKGLSSRIVSYHDRSRQYTKPIINRAYNRVGELPIVNFNKNNIPHRKNPLLNASISPLSSSRLEIAPPDKTNYQSRLEILRTGVMSSSQSDHHNHRIGDLSCENTLISGGGGSNNQSHQHHHSNNSSHIIENESLAPLDALKEISRKRIHSNHIVSDLIKKQRAEQQQQQQQQQLYTLDETINSRFGHNNCTSSFINYPSGELMAATSSAQSNTTTTTATTSTVINNKRNRDQTSPKTPPEQQLQKKRTCNNDVLSSLSSSLFLNKPKRKLDESISHEEGENQSKSIRQQKRNDSLVDHQTILNENQQEKRLKETKNETKVIEQKTIDTNLSNSFVCETDGPYKTENQSNIDGNLVETKQTHPKLTLFNKSYNHSGSTRSQSDDNKEINKNDENDDDDDDNQENQIFFIKPKLSSLVDDNVFTKKSLGKSKLALMLSCLSGEIDNDDDVNDTEDDCDAVDKGKENATDLIEESTNPKVINQPSIPLVTDADKINNQNVALKKLPIVPPMPELEKELMLAHDSTTFNAPLPPTYFNLPATVSAEISSLTTKPILSEALNNTTTITNKTNETVGFNTTITSSSPPSSSSSSSSTTLPTQKQPILNTGNVQQATSNVNTASGGGFSFNPITTTSPQPVSITQPPTNTVKPIINFSNNQSHHSSSVNKSLFQNLPTSTTKQTNPTQLDKPPSSLPTSVNSAFNKTGFNLPPTTTTATPATSGGFMSSQQTPQPAFGITSVVDGTSANNPLNSNKSFSLLSSPAMPIAASKQQSSINPNFKFGSGNDSNTSFSFLSNVDNDKKIASLNQPPQQSLATNNQGKSNTETVNTTPLTNTQAFSFGGSIKPTPTTATIPGGQLQQGNGGFSFGGGNNSSTFSFGGQNQSTSSSQNSFGLTLNQENKSQTTIAPQLAKFGTSITTTSENTFQFNSGGGGGGGGATAVTKSITEPTKSMNNAFVFGGGGGSGGSGAGSSNTPNTAQEPSKPSSNHLFSFGDSTKTIETSKPMGGNSAFTFGGSGGLPSFGGVNAFGGKATTSSSFTFNPSNAVSTAAVPSTAVSPQPNPIFNFGGSNSENKATTANLTGQPGTVVTKSMFTLPTTGGISATTTTTVPSTNLFSFGSSSSSLSTSTAMPPAQGQFNFSAGNQAIGGDPAASQQMNNLFSPGPSTLPMNAKGRVIRQATRKLNK